MGKHKRRTMFELLQQTSRLHKPRMTPVLEGKARMQGPLDQPDATTDFKSSEVCANCRNDLDATQMQNCMICSGGYHSVCLEILRNADDDDIRCCYKCQLSGVHDKTQSSSTGVVTNEVAHDEQPSAERMDGPRASDEVYVSKGLHTTESQAVNSNTNTKELETAAGKIISDSTEEVSKIVYNPSLTHPVKKQGVWRKEIADSLQFSGFVDQVELMSSDTCKKAMKGIVVDAKQIFAVLPERTGAGDIPDKQMVVEVFTKPARDNDVKNMPELFVSKKASDVKHLDCAITAEVQEEKESDKKLEASISEQGKSVENELEQGPITADKTFKDDQLSHTSSVLMGQSVITVPTFSANCFVESKKVKEIHGNVMREGCVLEELDCNKTCNKTQSFLLSSQLSGVKLSNEEQPTDQSFIAVDNDTAVALAPYEWTSSRKQDSHTDITQVETHVPKDTSHTTRSDHVGNVTKMDKHVDVLKECSTGLFKVPNVDEETSFLQDQGTLESEVSCATEANPFSGQDMENNAQNVVHYVDSQTGTVQGALLQTAVHPTAEKLAALESKLSCICVVSDRLENMAVEPCDCIHPVPASCPTISVDHFPASAATIKLLHGQCKQLLIATDEETILPKTWDSTFQNPTQGDLAGGQPPNGNVSEDKMEEVLAIVNLDQSALSTAESSLMILEAVCAPLGTPSVIGSLEGDLVLPQDATSIRVSLDDGISPQEDASSIRAPSSSDVKVCDICGDPGYEDMLAICSECSAGAEHVYCVQTLLGQVPEGCWQCEGCRLNQRLGGSKQTEIRPGKCILARLPSLNSSRNQSNTGDTRSRLSARLEKRKLRLEKRRALKGIPSSQFPAKRHAVENTGDAPSAKKQAVENSGPSIHVVNMSALRPGLCREGSFKLPDTGKVKLISHTALTVNGNGVQATGPASCGIGKLSHSVGMSNSQSPRTNMSQSGQVSKGRFANLSNLTSDSSGNGNASKVSASFQLSNSCTIGSSMISPGVKSSSLKSGDSMPSFLLPSKSSFGSKLQTSNKGSKEASELGIQGLPKEGLSGQALMASLRALSKTNSLKVPKATGASFFEQKPRADPHQGHLRLLGSKAIGCDAGLVKAVEKKCDSPFDSTEEHKSKASGAKILITSLDKSNGVACIPSDVASCSGNLITNRMASMVCAKELASEIEAVYVGPRLPGNPKCTQQGICDPESSSLKKIDENCCALEGRMDVVQADLPNSPSVPGVNAAERASIGVKQLILQPSFPTKSMHTMEEPCSFHAEGDQILQSREVSTVGSPSSDLGCKKKPLPVIDSRRANEQSKSSSSPRSDSRIRCKELLNCPNFVPSFGSTRCYRCKELGHSAPYCNNRNSTACTPSDLGSGALKGSASNVDCALKTSQELLEDTTSGKVKSSTTQTTAVMQPSVTDSESGLKISMLQLQGVNLNPVEVQGQEEQAEVSARFSPMSVSMSMDSGMKANAGISKQDTLERGALDPITGSSCMWGLWHREMASTKSMSSNGKSETSLANCPLPVAVVSKSTKAMDGDHSSTLFVGASSSRLPIAVHPAISPDLQATAFPTPCVIKSAAYVSATFGTSMSTPVNTTQVKYEEHPQVCPEPLSVWQGMFEVNVKGNLLNNVHGLQAHPSNRASSKVHEVAKKLQSRLQLEELPRGSEYNSWPLQFQKSPPNNDNIALYFFARDKESHEQSYKPLVDRLIKYNLTLKSYIEDAELLIFPSNLLPPASRCWNNFMFLWGVFRDRKPSVNQMIHCHLASVSKHPEMVFESMQSKQPAVQLGEEVQADRTEGKKVVSDMGGCGRRSLGFAVSCTHPELRATLPEQPASKLLQAVSMESSQQHGDREQVSQPIKAAALASIDLLADTETQHSKLVNSRREDLRGLDSPPGFESATQKQVSVSKVREEGNIHTEVITVSISKSNNALQPLPRKVLGVETSGLPPLRQSPLAPSICPSARERQGDAWIPHKLSHSHSRSPTRYQDRDTERGICNYNYDRNWERERIESRTGYRDRGRERESERERDRNRDRNRERQRRHQGWERERERERRDRYWHREREERERAQGREREKERDRGRERMQGRDRRRRRDYELADIDRDRESGHWRRHPHSGSPSWSPLKLPNQSRSPSPMSGSDHNHYRYWPLHNSRSYSHSPDSEGGSAQLQSRAESRDRSQDNFAGKGKPSAVSLSDPRARDERVMKNKSSRDSAAEDLGSLSHPGNNREHLSRPKVWSTPIADLNVSPMETDGIEDVLLPEVVQSVTDHEGSGDYHDFFSTGINCAELGEPTKFVGIYHTDQGESSNSVSKVLLNHPPALNLLTIHEEHDYYGISLVKNSMKPSHSALSFPSETSSSCLKFFPLAGERADDQNTSFNVPDLNLALSGKGKNLHKEPLFIQPLESHKQISGPRLSAMSTFSDASSKQQEQAALALSLAFPQPTQVLEMDVKRLVGDESVSTSLCLG